jgi:hypothetical protein
MIKSVRRNPAGISNRKSVSKIIEEFNSDGDLPGGIDATLQSFKKYINSNYPASKYPESAT